MADLKPGEIQRNLESGGNLYLNKFYSGLYKNRSPLYTPISALGVSVIARQDVLWDGHDMMVTPQYTLRRRYGHSRACSQTFGASEWPRAFFSFVDLNGTIFPFADTQSRVCNFSSAVLGTLLNKSAGAGQSSFNSVANTMYFCNGIDAFKYVGPNLLLQSDNFGSGTTPTAPWVLNNITLTGGQTDPLGGTAATKMQATSLSNPYIYQDVTPNYSPVVGNTFTFSVWAKLISGTGTFDLQMQNTTGLITVTPTSSWVKYSVTGVASSSPRCLLWSFTSTSLVVDFYGAQLEVGGVVTPTQITTTLPQGVYLWGIQAPTTASTLSFGAGALSPFVGYQYGYCWKNPLTSHISTMSPASASSGPQTSKNITVQGGTTADPQATIIQIYRTRDGGGNFFLLAEIANPGGTFSYVDSTPDTGLNQFIIAPLAHVNDPPPTGAKLTFWYGGRLWVIVGNTAYFSAGPDALNGVGAECFPPGNNFAVPGSVNAAAPTSQGLIYFTQDDAYVTTGNSASTFTTPTLWQENWGVPSQNAVTQDNDNVFIFASRGQVYNFSANGISELGFFNAKQFGAMTPASVYISIHRSGEDEGLFVSDGVSNIWRYSQTSRAWDTPMQPIGGCGAIGSIEQSNGAWALMMAPPTGSKRILKRDLTVFSDDSTTYTASLTMGSLVIAPPRQVAHLESVLLQIAGIAGATYPVLSVMLNEVNDTGVFPATFTALPNPVPDPPQLVASTTVLAKRHDLKAGQRPLPQHVQHLQVKVDFVAEAFANEVYGIGLAHKN
jgi:hypothetical protein